jgi:hypothetical protein
MLKRLNKGKKMINFQRVIRGDTIVEVVIGIALLGTVLAGTYISTSHSLRQGTDSGNRNRAVAFGQQQVEQLAAADKIGAISAYTLQHPGEIFCVDKHSSYIYNSNQPCSVCVTTSGLEDAVIGSGSCPNADDQKLYQLGVVYDPTSKIFTATMTWQAPNGSGQDSTVVYYKLPESVPAAGGLCTDPAAKNYNGPLPCQYDTIVINATILMNPNRGIAVQVKPFIGGSSNPAYTTGPKTVVYAPYGVIYPPDPPVTYNINPQPCQDPGVGQVSTSNPSGPPFVFQFDKGDSAKGIVGERCQDATIVVHVPADYGAVKYILVDFAGNSSTFPVDYRDDVRDNQHREIQAIAIRSITYADGSPHTVTFDSYKGTLQQPNENPPKGSVIGAGQYNLLQEYPGVVRPLSAFIVN